MKALLYHCLVLLILVAPYVSASADDYEITSVYVNGIAAEGSTVQVELGRTAQIQVYLEGTGDLTDVRVRAWIGGYEYGSIETITDVFDVEDGVSYKKYLALEIPEDLDVSDHVYTLHVEVYDSNSREERDYVLYFEQERHALVIEDVLLSSSTVAAGDYLAVQVRLENQGEKDEEDLKITVSIPDLGVSTRVYMEELASGEQDTAPNAYLQLPLGASGVYEVLISVEYNNGYSSVEGVSYVEVAGEVVYDENTFVSISSIPSLVVGEESSYKVQVSNLGKTPKLFYLTVDGLDASYTPVLSVPSGSTGEFSFTLSPETVGTAYVFVEVRTDEGLVTQKLFIVSVEEESSAIVIFLSLFFGLLVAVGIILYLRKF